MLAASEEPRPSSAPSRVLGRAAAVVFLGVGAALGLGSAGCPANFCFLKVCDGRGECSCPLSTCADGAGFDTTQNRCRCLRGFFEVAGHCLDQQHANAYCGKGYGFENGGCLKLACKTGDTLDATTGLCVPKEQLAAQSGVQVGQGQKVGCPAGDTLVVDNGIGACVPAGQACARDETWNGQGLPESRRVRDGVGVGRVEADVRRVRARRERCGERRRRDLGADDLRHERRTRHAGLLLDVRDTAEQLRCPRPVRMTSSARPCR